MTASYPYFTPYQFAANTPIAAIDLDGLESEIVISSPWTTKEIDCLLKLESGSDIEQSTKWSLYSITRLYQDGWHKTHYEKLILFNEEGTAATFNACEAEGNEYIRVYGTNEDGSVDYLFDISLSEASEVLIDGEGSGLYIKDGWIVKGNGEDPNGTSKANGVAGGGIDLQPPTNAVRGQPLIMLYQAIKKLIEEYGWGENEVITDTTPTATEDEITESGGDTSTVNIHRTRPITREDGSKSGSEAYFEKATIVTDENSGKSDTIKRTDID